MVTKSEARRASRRIARSMLRTLGAGIYYGIITHFSFFESKVALCHLCRVYLQDVTPTQFWALLSLLLTFFILFNYHLGRLCYINLKRSGSSLCQGRRMAKYTRAGTIYGFM